MFIFVQVKAGMWKTCTRKNRNAATLCYGEFTYIFQIIYSCFIFMYIIRVHFTVASSSCTSSGFILNSFIFLVSVFYFYSVFYKISPCFLFLNINIHKYKIFVKFDLKYSLRILQFLEVKILSFPGIYISQYYIVSSFKI